MSRRACALLACAALATGCAPAPVTTRVTITLPGGILYEPLQEGSGPSPRPADTVRVHYRGIFTDGTVFDSSHQRGEPAEFALTRVIRCWTEGLQRMKPGGKAMLTCPPATAYGERGVPGLIPPHATLRFEVELLAVKPPARGGASLSSPGRPAAP